MKQSTKIFSALMAITCFFALSMPASCTNTKTSKITLNNTTAGTTYDLYRFLDKINSTDSEKSPSYEVSSEWENFFKQSDLGEEYIIDTNDSNKLNTLIKFKGNNKYLNITTQNMSEFSRKAFNYINKLKNPTKRKKAESNSLTFDEVKPGYYITYPTGTILISSEENDESLNLTKSDALNSEPTVEINSPTITNISQFDSFYSVGDIATYKIEGTIPDITEYGSYSDNTETEFTNYKYTIDVTLEDDLIFDSNSLGNFKINNEISLDNLTDDFAKITEKPNKTGFTVDLNWNKYSAYATNAFEFTYSAQLTSFKKSIFKSTAKLTYSDNPNDINSVKEYMTDEYVYTFNLVLDKRCAQLNGLPLSGAKFKIFSIDPNDSITNLTNKSKFYYVKKSDGSISWEQNSQNPTEAPSQATIIETQSDGTATIEGIGCGKTYENGSRGPIYIEEVEAPKGFTINISPVGLFVSELTIVYTDTSWTSAVLKRKNDIFSVVTTIVNRNDGTPLPETGGPGTICFTFAGILLLLGAGVILIKNKRAGKKLK